MSEASFLDFSRLLEPDGPVAIAIKQSLAPVNEDDLIIFPPSYPMTRFKGRVHTVLDGDYRVSVELPATATGKTEKQKKDSEQTSGYNIDRFPDGTNSCEIDSPQSQANRIEPLFNLRDYQELVPQIQIKLGSELGTSASVNLLDAGHRAADAVVRLSSLADKFHSAFLDAKQCNHFTLATLAPTSLLFGVWDSRSTQVKLQRILRASIRVSNVRECTRSAQFTPAADYVATRAVDAALDKDEGDQNPLSSEGMKHALAVQKVGGVMLTPKSSLTRTVTVNLVAIRALGTDSAERTDALRQYILSLALIAATVDPDLNLREGCHLRFIDQLDSTRLILRRGGPEPVTFDSQVIRGFATTAAKAFFHAAGIPFENKDYPDAVFESGVAEEFLAMGDDRDKVRKMGPITAATLRRFRELSNDPWKPLMEAVQAAKKALGKRKKGEPAQNPTALRPVLDVLAAFSENLVLPEDARAVALELTAIGNNDRNSHETLGQIEGRIKAFKKLQKEAIKIESGDVKE